jgi:hypothetical protein
MEEKFVEGIENTVIYLSDHHNKKPIYSYKNKNCSLEYVGVDKKYSLLFYTLDDTKSVKVIKIFPTSGKFLNALRSK